MQPVLRLHRNIASGSSGRPSVFVVEVVDHSLGSAGIGNGIDQVEPLFTEIFSGETHSRMHEIAAEAHVLHHAHLTDEFILVKFAVPGPERLAPPFVGRIGELSDQFTVTQSVVCTPVRAGDCRDEQPGCRDRHE